MARGTPEGLKAAGVHHGRHLATADERQKLSPNVHHCAQPATGDSNSKLSQSGHNGAQPAANTEATGLRQRLPSRDEKRLARLLEQYGYNSETRNRAPKAFIFEPIHGLPQEELRMELDLGRGAARSFHPR